MTRINKNDPNSALAAAAKAIRQARDKASVVPRAQQGLVDLFMKFIGRKQPDEVTANDVGQAVAQARAQLVAEYGLDKDEPTQTELEQAAQAGRRSMDLAKALKAAAATAG